MKAVKVTIIEFTDASQPGWVRCRLTDVNSKEWLFDEKVPVVTTEEIDQNTVYPKPGVIACQIVGKIKNENYITINTEKPWGVESTTGNYIFDVYPEQLIEL